MTTKNRQAGFLATWIVVASLLLIPCGLRAQSSGDQDSQTAQPDSSLPPLQTTPQALPNPAAPGQAPDQTQPATPESAVSQTSSGAQVSQVSQTPVPNNIESGLPLRTVLSPIHWGHLSLLSATAFGAYDSNYQLQQRAQTSSIGAVQGLLVYSIRHANSSLDLQYHPYVFYTQGTAYKDLMANTVDFATSHTLGPRWRLTLNDSFEYSPELSSSLGPVAATEFTTGASSQLPFLANGRRFWTDNLGIGLSHPLSSESELSFNTDAGYAHLSFGDSLVGQGNTSGTPTGQGLVSSQQQWSYGAGAAWTKNWDARNTFSLNYGFQRRQITALNTGLNGTTDIQTATAAYTRRLKPSLYASIEAGPAFMTRPGLKNNATPLHTTLQGGVSLTKAFRKGGISVSASRSTNFSGLISNSLNNRYDLTASRKLLPRVTVSASGSYVQQEFIGQPTVNGEMAYGEIGYNMTRNWSVFSGYRYFNSDSGQRIFGPQQIVGFGIRWAWEPSESHN